MKRSSDVNIVIGLGILAIVSVSFCWFLWFAVRGPVKSLSPGDPSFQVYSAYELAFPLPDACVVIGGLVGMIGLWRLKDWGFLAMWMAAGGSLFLGFEDLLFDLENGMLIPFGGTEAVELAIMS